MITSSSWPSRNVTCMLDLTWKLQYFFFWKIPTSQIFKTPLHYTYLMHIWGKKKVLWSNYGKLKSNISNIFPVLYVVFASTDIVCAFYTYIFFINLLSFWFSVKLHRTGEGQARNRWAVSYTTMSKYLNMFTVPTDTQWI